MPSCSLSISLSCKICEAFHRRVFSYTTIIWMDGYLFTWIITRQFFSGIDRHENQLAFVLSDAELECFQVPRDVSHFKLKLSFQRFGHGVVCPTADDDVIGLDHHPLCFSLGFFGLDPQRGSHPLAANKRRRLIQAPIGRRLL